MEKRRGRHRGFTCRHNWLESVPVLHTDQAMEALEGWDGKDSVTKLSELVRRSVKPVLNTWYPPSYRKKWSKF